MANTCIMTLHEHMQLEKHYTCWIEALVSSGISVVVITSVHSENTCLKKLMMIMLILLS